MSQEKVETMAIHAGDSMLWTPEMALKSTIDDLGKIGAFKKGKKILILGLDDEQDSYSVSFCQAGMTMSECLALCEAAKAIFLTEMKYIPQVQD